MNPNFSKNEKFRRLALYIISLVAVCTIIVKLILNWDATHAAISNLLDILQPFLLGALIAYFLNPLANLIDKKILCIFFQKKHMKVRKFLAIILAYLIVIGSIIMILFYIIPQIADSVMQVTSLFNSAQTGYNELMNYIVKLEEEHTSLDLTVLKDTIQEIPVKLFSFVTEKIPTILPTIYATSMNVISGVLNLLIAIMVSIYMLIDKRRLLNTCTRVTYALLGIRNGDKLIKTTWSCNRIFTGFIVGKLIDSTIIGILCFILMSILKLDYAVMISVIVGITNMIPYFGPFIGAIPGILILMIVDLKQAVIFLILIIALQQFDGLVLGPKILGDSTGLRPLWIIFAITVGGSVAGVLGMFLGVPTVAVIAYLLEHQLNRTLKKRHIEFDCNPDSGALIRKGEPPAPPSENTDSKETKETEKEDNQTDSNIE